MTDGLHIKPKLHDRIRVLAGELKDCEGLIRAVYEADMISASFTQLEANDFMRENLVLHPETKMFHWILAPGEYEIFGRKGGF